MRFKVTNTTSFPQTLNVVVDGTIQACLVYPGTHVVSATSIPAQQHFIVAEVSPEKSAAVVPATPSSSTIRLSFKKD